MKEMNLKKLPDLAKQVAREKRFDFMKKDYEAHKAQFEAESKELAVLLNDQQGRAKERTFTAYTLCLMLYDVQEKVSTRKALEGTKVTYNFGQKFPSAYKWTPSSTTVKAEFRKGSWRLTYVDRDDCPNRQAAGSIEFSESAKLDIIQRASTITELY